VPVDDISIRRRRSGGVTVFKVDEGERVVSVARLPDTGEDVGNGNGNGNVGAGEGGEA
jgi:DNA gyrase subunit A